jgi:hypothetical protein
MAHTTSFHLDEHLVLARRLQRDVLEAKAPASFLEGGPFVGLGQSHGIGIRVDGLKGWDGFTTYKLNLERGNVLSLNKFWLLPLRVRSKKTFRSAYITNI